MQNTVKEHYVPRFYLRNFEDENHLLHIYDFKQKNFFTQSSKNICYVNNLYETKWENANPKLGKLVMPNHIEKIFCKNEREFSKTLTAILKLCTPSQEMNARILHGKERNMFFRFIVNMIVRNPENMKAFALNQLEPNVTAIDERKEISPILDYMGFGGADSIIFASLKKALLTDEFENSFTQACLKSLIQLNYAFFYARTNSFITSNIPVCVGDDLKIIEDDKTCIYCALSPKVAVLFGNFKKSHIFKNRMVCIEEKQVENFNRIFMMYSDEKRFLIGNSDSLIRKYV